MFATKTKNELKSKEIKILEKSHLTALTNCKKSVLFMQTLTSVTLSNIMYNRNFFKKSSFNLYDFYNLKLPIIKENSSDKYANDFFQCLKAIQDPLDKKYLRELIINFYKDADCPETLFESYVFQYKYTDKNIMVELNKLSQLQSKKRSRKVSTTSESIQKAILTLLSDTYVACNQMDEIPDQWELCIKLLYYENVTPADYEPPGFSPCDQTDYNDTLDQYRLGVRVATPYHQMKLCSFISKETDNFETDWSMDNNYHSLQNQPTLDRYLATQPENESEENDGKSKKISVKDLFNETLFH